MPVVGIRACWEYAYDHVSVSLFYPYLGKEPGTGSSSHRSAPLAGAIAARLPSFEAPGSLILPRLSWTVCLCTACPTLRWQDQLCASRALPLRCEEDRVKISLTPFVPPLPLWS
jgi:hypothetical protein